MKKNKILCRIMLVLCLLFVFPSVVFAYSEPDTAATGSISIEVVYDGEAVPGGAITVYQVGDINEDNGNYSFVLTEEFNNSGVSLDDVESAETASALADYASENNITGTEVSIGSDGKASINDLAAGLYLVVQTTAADGFEAFNPFLVSIPLYVSGEYVYNVDATPKMELTKASGDDSSLENPADSDTSSDDSDDQTGETSVSEDETASGSSDVQTGDTSNLRLWFILFCMSLLIIIIMAVRIKYERDEKFKL